MNITFQKQNGRSILGIQFFWRMSIERGRPSIEAGRPSTVTDLFIPELFYDYFYIKNGRIQCEDNATTFPLPQSSLKTLYTHPLTFTYSTPLILFGARFTPAFAESYWEAELPKNRFLPQTWLQTPPDDLEDFQSQVTAFIEQHKRPKNPYPMLTPAMQETIWLAAYSPRHKRRLYKATFGLSRKEMESVRSVQAFLEQTCDFGADYPRIIEHVNPERFYDQPHLNHTFKNVTGLSPLAYFEANTILQDNLMAASYNALPRQ